MPTPGAELDEAFQRVIRDLRTQYMIGFYPRGTAPTKERFHKVTLGVSRPGHTVSSRNGYYSDDVLTPPSKSGPKPLGTEPGVR
jgi:Ca-activated chloride channel family protein